MKLKYKFVTRKIGEEYISVPVGKDAGTLHAMMRLNATGADIVQMLDKDVTAEGIACMLAKKYHRQEAEMLSYVNEFIGELTAQGLIV